MYNIVYLTIITLSKNLPVISYLIFKWIGKKRFNVFFSLLVMKIMEIIRVHVADLAVNLQKLLSSCFLIYFYMILICFHFIF